MGTPLHPTLYQINTRVWLMTMAELLGRPATLDDIPDAEPDRLAQCYIALPPSDLAGAEWRLWDQIDEAVCDRDGGDLQHRGLYADATPWQVLAFSLTRRSSGV